MTRSGYLPDLVLFFEFGGCLGAERAGQPGASDGRTSRVRLPANRSAQNQEVKPVASGSGFAVSSASLTARRRRSLPRRSSSSLRLRIVVSAWRNVSTWPRKSARLVGVRLRNLLKSVLVESRGRERLAGIFDRRVGLDSPSGLREPSDEFDPVQSAREALSDEDRGTGAEHAADLVCGDS